MKYNCKTCSYSIDNTSNWNKHIKSQKHMKKLIIVQNDSQTDIRDEKIKEEISELVNNKIKLFMDDIKNFIDKRLSTDINNQNAPSGSVNAKQKSYVCLHCKMECSKGYNLTRHMKKCILAKINVIDDDNDELIKLGDVSTRQQKPSETAENDKNNKKELECQYCGITCKRSCNLIQHMNKCAKIIKV